MKHGWFRVLASPALAALSISLLAAPAPAAPKYEVLHAFGKGSDGAGILAGLAWDGHGNLYGGTTGGGAYGHGTVFQLGRGASGKWSETIIHSFCDSRQHCSDGAGAASAPAVDPSGNLFGSSNTASFQISPGPDGWNFTVIYDAASHGWILDQAGNLYGNTAYGVYGFGAATELSPGSNGWTEQYLYSFQDHDDGDAPIYDLTWDNSGNLYGLTQGGGVGNTALAFQLQHTASGWQENILHNFPAFKGDAYPIYGGLAFNSRNGRLYGTGVQGGKANLGAVYELRQLKDGTWKERLIYQFSVVYDGAGPAGTLAIDPSGNLYGIAGGGTGPCGGGGCGVVYKLTRHKSGKWSYQVLHRFLGPDGALPQAGPILDSKSNLYGTTEIGGEYGAGVVYEITP